MALTTNTVLGLHLPFPLHTAESHWMGVNSNTTMKNTVKNETMKDTMKAIMKQQILQ